MYNPAYLLRLASDALPDPSGSGALPPSDLGFAFLKMMLTFLLIIALLGATYWIIRKMIRLRLEKGVGSQAIEIVEKRMISPKTTLYLAKVQGETFLFAESQLEVKSLKPFSGQKGLDRLSSDV